MYDTLPATTSVPEYALPEGDLWSIERMTDEERARLRQQYEWSTDRERRFGETWQGVAVRIGTANAWLAHL